MSGQQPYRPYWGLRWIHIEMKVGRGRARVDGEGGEGIIFEGVGGGGQ